MGWENRDYNRYGSEGGGDYLANPLGILSLTVPFGTWFGSRVRLHFWLLFQFFFVYMAGIWSGNLVFPTVICCLIIAALLMHEFAHRAIVERMGGSHNEFVLWPFGGMVPPQVPPGAWSMFAGFSPGIAVNLMVAIGCLVAVKAMTGAWPAGIGILALIGFGGMPMTDLSPEGLLATFMWINIGLVTVNLLPYYWFDGGYLLQSILWPWLGNYRAINVTCIVGMVIAVPLFVLSVAFMSIFGMIWWALLFASSYTRRRELQASGTNELEEAIAWSASHPGYDDEAADTSRATRRRSRPRWGKSNAKAIERAKKDAERIDQILAKVHEKGMQSLTWGERRALRQATARQQQRDRQRAV